MDETKSTCFCLKEIADSKKTIAYLREQLPKVRALYDKYKGTGLKRELDALADMQRLVKQLWEEFPALIRRSGACRNNAESVRRTEKIRLSGNGGLHTAVPGAGSL